MPGTPLSGAEEGDYQWYLLGGDNLARDVFSRVVKGAWVVVQIAPLATLFAFMVGITLGLPAGFYAGKLDTILSFIANLILASRAHFDARTAPGGLAVVENAAPHPGTCALAGWFVPGLGHVLQGRRARGVVAFVLVVGLFLLGRALAEGTHLDRTRHFYYWAGQALLGPVAFAVEFVHGHPRMVERAPYADAGVVLASIAGMLNVLLLLDVYGFSESRLLGRPVATDRRRPVDEEPALP